MTKLRVDDVEIEVPPEYTLLQACEAAGAEIPRFCFHERLSIAGNCRMCLVEVKGGPQKPVASCAMAVRDLRPGPKGEPPVVLTKSPMVKKARQGVMEFLLINHPLDCPICDQGGECDLQDQAIAFGFSRSRYAENKRAVEDKYIGPLVRTSMNRCIHCTRCVRFTAEVAGTGDMGAIGRGEDMEITTYLETAMGSELQGNVADLCPVGALLPMPYSFKARSWELTKSDSIDVMDALGSAIRVDSRGREVMRILPRINDAVNEEWISDKTRQIVDGLKTQRLDQPYLREGGKLRAATWQEAFAAIAAKVKSARPERIGAIAGDLCSVEEMFALKLLIASLGSTSLDCRQDGTKLDPKFGRASYIFNPTVAGIEEADAIMIIGSNPRREAPVFNARIRKRWLKGNLLLGVIGEKADLTYDYNYLGAGPETLARFVEHRPAQKERPMLLIGQGALARPDGLAILVQAAKAAISLGCMKPGWLGFGILHTAAARVGGLDLGFVPGQGGLDAAGMAKEGALDVLFNLGADEIDIDPRRFRDLSGHAWRPRARARADVILPGATYTEKSGHLRQHGGPRAIGRAGQFPARRCARGLGDLARSLGCSRQDLAFDSCISCAPCFMRNIRISPSSMRSSPVDAEDIEKIAADGIAPSAAPFASPVADFYMTNPIARASAVMAECSALARGLMKQAAE